MCGHDHCEEYIDEGKGPVYVLSGSGFECCYASTAVDKNPKGSIKVSKAAQKRSKALAAPHAGGAVRAVCVLRRSLPDRPLPGRGLPARRAGQLCQRLLLQRTPTQRAPLPCLLEQALLRNASPAVAPSLRALFV